MDWSLDPTIIAGLALLAALYIRGQFSIARRVGKLTAFQLRRTWAFTGAIVVLIAALLSPLDILAGQFFSAHMMQHSLLMLGAALLLALSNPLPPLLMGLPAFLRRALGRGWRRSRWLKSVWRWASRPPAALMIQAVILWIWHIPMLYQSAIADDRIHALEHLSMLGAALLFWWVALHIFGDQRRGKLPGTIYLVSAVLPGGLLGAVLALAPTPWYPIYAHPAGPLTPLADQQLAATMMWAPAGSVYLLAAILMMQSKLNANKVQHAKV